MLRYHKKVYFASGDIDRLKAFTANLNALEWQYSTHCLENIKYRALDIKGLLLFIRDLKLDNNQIFEYYAEEKSRDIIKVCYRIPFKAEDIILVLSADKKIITIYLNSRDDDHFTLKEYLYNKE